MPRTKSVLLRLTEEEHSRLKELAGREPVSAYLRRVALADDDGPLTPAASKVLRDAWTSPALEEQLRATTVPVKVASTPPGFGFKCPVSSCDYRARSLAARCPRHGRLVVPA